MDKLERGISKQIIKKLDRSINITQLEIYYQKYTKKLILEEYSI